MVLIADRRLALFPLLAVLLVLGHVCDLPAYAETAGAPHSAEDSHHHSDGQEREQLTSCDPVSATSSPGYTHPYVGLGTARALPASGSISAHPVARSFEDRATLLVRPPLFLLHAALLI
jgi:hypothetical protein